MLNSGSIVSYGDHELQTIKYFHFQPSNSQSLVFIHGGAWRSPKNTYDDFLNIIDLLKPTCHYNLVGINYRLSPKVKHPAHLEDVFHGLQTIQKNTMTKLFLLVGHSVGATLILQLLNYHELARKHNVCNDLVFENVYFVDGIYDVPELLKEYTEYKSFVMEAFSGETDYREATQVSKEGFTSFECVPKTLIVVHSKQDELLSERQARLFAHFLCQHKVTYTFVEENWGKHDQVYMRKELADLIAEIQLKA